MRHARGMRVAPPEIDWTGDAFALYAQRRARHEPREGPRTPANFQAPTQTKRFRPFVLTPVVLTPGFRFVLCEVTVQARTWKVGI